MARDPGPATTFQQGFPWPGLGPRASRGCVRGTTAFSPPPAAAHRNFFSSGRPGERSPSRTTLKPPVHLVSDRRQCSRGRGEGTRGFPSPGSRGPSKGRLGTPISHAPSWGWGWGEDTGNRREAVGLLRVPCAPRGSAAPPYPATPPPSRPSPCQDPPAASGPPPRARRSGTAAARTRSGWFSPPPPPARGGSRRRRGCHGPPARAAARAPGAAVRPRPSPAEPPGLPPRAGSCPAGSPGSKSWSAGLRLQAHTPRRRQHARRARSG